MDECQHRPGLIDRLRYYAHIIFEPCRFTAEDSDMFLELCLTTDWIENGMACPRCCEEYIRECSE